MAQQHKNNILFKGIRLSDTPIFDLVEDEYGMSQLRSHHPLTEEQQQRIWEYLVAEDFVSALPG